MKKWRYAVLTVLLGLVCVFSATGCGLVGKDVKETMAEQKSSGEGTRTDKKETKSKAEEEVPTYTFVDVLGQRYEAELLEDMPMCSYDYANLTEKDGYKYYVDEEQGISSVLGIDVSEFQGDIDWAKVKEAGIEFVIIRLGYRGYGEEGKLVLDANFEKNIEGAKAAGLETGVYFFSQAVSDAEAKEEADFVLSHIEGHTLTMPVVFDTEEIKGDTARTDENTRERFTDNCIVFCDAIEEAGYDTMIYANMKWMAFTLNLERLTGYDFWYADYEAKPQCPYPFVMWQYTETGSVPGIEGNVDLNIWFVEE